MRAGPESPKGVERRGSPRVRSTYFLNGGIEGDPTRSSSSFMGTTVDLSMGGCLIRTYEALERGMDVTVTLNLPEGDLKARGRIVHAEEDAVGCRMCGVRFVPLAGESHSLLARHLSQFGVTTTPAKGSAKTPKVDGRSPSRKILVEGRVHRD
jgi:c-di-GMP-binding flagellar brake protein YcgR